MNKTLLPKEEWRNYSKKLSKKCFKKLTDQKLHSTLTFSSEKKKTTQKQERTRNKNISYLAKKKKNRKIDRLN